MSMKNFIWRTLSASLLSCIFATGPATAATSSALKTKTAHEQSNGISYWMDWTFSNKKIHVLEIDLTNPKISLRASTNNERGMTPSEFSAKSGALAVINGDFFDGNKKPVGLAVGQGQVWPGTADTKEWSFLACDDDNDCFIEPYNKVSQANPNWTSVVGGWQLLLDPNFEWEDANDRECGEFCTTLHPRTVIGLSEDRTTLWWVVVEGRQGNLTGLTLASTTRLMKQLGATWALNLDGGGSSGLVLNGRLMNGRPFNEPFERRVANCLAVVGKP
ncbi:phosphodiester glycosidase family protein [bacterium]|nr:phosphodiester glycosidase family protein [bacterium]